MRPPPIPDHRHTSSRSRARGPRAGARNASRHLWRVRRSGTVSVGELHHRGVSMNVEPWGTTGPGASTLVVPAIQYLLRAHGHAVVVDGAYGPATTAAVSAVQSAAGVPADGIVGPQTWPHLVISTQNGSTGDAVRAVQQFGLVPSPGVPPARRRRRFRPHHRGPRAVLPGVLGAHAGRRRRARDLVVLQHLPTGRPTVAPGEGRRNAEFELARARGAAPAAFPGRDDRGGRRVRSAQRRGGAHVPDDPARHVHLAPPWASSTGRR